MKQFRKWVLPLLAAALILVLGGNLIYQFRLCPGEFWSPLFLALENTLLTILGGPLVSPADMCRQALQGAGPDWEKWALCGTSLSSLLIFVIQVCILVKIADLFLHILPSWHHKPHRALLIGSQDLCQSLLDRPGRDMQVYFWSQTLMKEEFQKELLKRRITPEYRPYPSEDRGREIEEALGFLKKKKITHVVLADSSDAKNMQMYLTLSDCPYCEARSVQFHALCRDWENQQVLENYFDSELKKKAELHKLQKGYDPHMDLQIFSYPRIHAQRMFEQLPLHQFTGKDHRIRLLILGGGETGQAVLVHAMNQAVITGDNAITIDLVDRDADSLSLALEKRFSPTYVKHRENQFFIDPDKADGSLTITLHQAEIRSASFADFLRQEQQGPEPFTYIALCLPQPDDNLYCSYLFETVFDGTESPVALAFRMDRSSQMCAHLQSLSWCREVLFLGSGSQSIGLSQVVDIPQEQAIRKYNYTYSRITSKMYGWDLYDAQVLWNRLPYFKRESNRALYHHQVVKKAMSPQKVPGKTTDADRQWAEFLDEKAMEDAGFRKNHSLWLISQDRGLPRFPDLVAAARAEHRRFCYHMASRGWGDEPVPGRLTQKVHSCLVPWDALTKSQPDKLIYDLISAPQMMDRDEETQN